MVRGFLIIFVLCLSVTVSININADELKNDINSATAEDLVRVKGIGEKKAQAILDYIKESNGIKVMDELLSVRGVGEKTLEKLKKEFEVKKQGG